MRRAAITTCFAFLALSGCKTGDGGEQAEAGDDVGSETTGDGDTTTTDDTTSTGDGDTATGDGDTTSDGDTTTGDGDLPGPGEVFALVGMRHESNDTIRVQVIDVSDNDMVYASESLLLRGGTGVKVSQAPWDGVILETPSTVEQARLDEQGQPALVPLLPPEVTGEVFGFRFSDDGSTMLIVVDDGGLKLWTVDYLDGEPVDAAMVATIDDNAPTYALTPDGETAFWIQPQPDPAGASLFMAPLQPEPGAPVELATDLAVPLFDLGADKLVWTVDLDEMVPGYDAFVLSLDALGDAPAPGPSPYYGGDYSSDGRWYCQNGSQLGDEVQLFEYSGAELIDGYVDAASVEHPGSNRCAFPRDDLLIYGTNGGSSYPNQLAMVDLSMGQPGTPALASTVASDGIRSWTVSPGAQWLAYIAYEIMGSRVEVVDISGTSPGVPSQLVDGAGLDEELIFIGDDRLLFTGAGDIFTVDLSQAPPVVEALDVGKPAGHWSDRPIAVTPDQSAVLFRVGEPGVFPTPPATIWRAGTDGVAPFMQLTSDEGWLPGSIAFLEAP